MSKIYNNYGHIKFQNMGGDFTYDFLNNDYQFLLADETQCSDADLANKTGNYYTTAECTGLPLLTTFDGNTATVHVKNGSLKVLEVDGYITQIYISNRTSDAFIRTYYNTGWGSWKLITSSSTAEQCFVTPQMFYTDSWATAFQKAFDSGKLVFVPKGTYTVDSVIKINNERTIVIGCGNVTIECNSNDAEHALEIHGSYSRVENITIKYTGTNENFHSVLRIGGLETWESTDGFNTELHNVAIRGNEKLGIGLWVGAAEVRVQNCKVRGAGTTGVRVHAPDSNFYNVYCEQNGGVGFESRGNGSIDAYHIHSYSNGSHGFYLNGCDYSNFMECYADRNKGMGFYITDCKRALTFENCWSFYSEGDYHIYCENVRQAIFSNCRFTKATAMVSAFRLKNSWVHVMNSYLDDKPAIVYSSNSQFLIENCYGELEKFNRNYGEIYFSTNIPAGETYHVSVLTDIPSTWLKTDPDLLNWNIDLSWRQLDLLKYGQLSFKTAVPWQFTTSSHPPLIKSNKTDSDCVDLVSIEQTVENDHLLVNMGFTNSGTSEIQLGGYLKYNGNARSLSISPQD